MLSRLCAVVDKKLRLYQKQFLRVRARSLELKEEAKVGMNTHRDSCWVALTSVHGLHPQRAAVVAKDQSTVEYQRSRERAAKAKKDLEASSKRATRRAKLRAKRDAKLERLRKLNRKV